MRISTADSRSWVAWAEIEVIGRHSGFDGPPQNVSLGASARASNIAPGSSANNAIDGDEATAWNAGDFPPQWIEIDLGQPCVIDRIRLLVMQNPAGDTVHVVEVGPRATELREIRRFADRTQGGEWLEFDLEDSTPIPGGDANPDLPRGLAWVRNNPMFISGLAVSVPTPNQAKTREYFDDFNANAVHLWANGLPTQMRGWADANHPGFRWVSWLSNDGTSVDGGQLLGGYPPDSPGRIGYQIGDEPGLNRDGMEELREVELGIDAVRATDPNALLIVNFSWWADELQEMMDYYGGTMDGDIISYDLYSLRQSTYQRLEYFRAAGLRWNMPYWRYIFSYQDVGENNWPGESDLRWDAFLGLAYGYTGHTWFVYQVAEPHIVTSAFYAGQGGLEVAKTERWAMAAQINREMSNLGRAITQLTSTEVCYLPGESLGGLLQPTDTRDWTPGAGGNPYITEFIATSDVEFILRGSTPA